MKKCSKLIMKMQAVLEKKRFFHSSKLYFKRFVCLKRLRLKSSNLDVFVKSFLDLKINKK